MSAVTLNALQDHFAYTIWASSRLVQAASQLSPEELSRDFGTADRGIIGTLGHIVSSDRIWLARLQRDPNPPGRREEDKTLPALQYDWPAIHERWKLWLDSLDDNAAEQVISYADLKGNRWSEPMWQIILHVVNHGTHHRGQVSGFLRALGHTPPPLDLIAYYRSLL